MFTGELFERLNKASRIAILTGAGVSAESGIKTFRDPGGLWAKFSPEELASAAGFLANPERVLEWYRHRKEIVGKSKPNPGHFAFADMEKIFPQVTTITQNIDRLHQKAGSKNVIELHGNLVDNHCHECKKEYTGALEFESGDLPYCECGGIIRPSVVWFGELLPPAAIQAAEEAACRCDVFICAGTSAEVYPAAGLPGIAKNYGAFLVEVNPRESALSPMADLALRAPSGKAMPRLLKEYKEMFNEDV